MNARILVVDDEPALLLTLVANLEIEGFDVVGVGSGAEALATIDKQPFDLVLSDVRMPEMNGVELFRRLRKRHPEVPVLLMTAFAMEQTVREAISEGAYAVFPKPFHIAHLVEALLAASRRPIVLVVDDEVPVADSIAQTLRQAGVRARAAFDGDSALAAFRHGNIDVCVVDMVMPGLSGPELVDRIRAAEPAVSLIALSGQDASEAARRAASRVFAYLRKPVDRIELLEAIARARGRARNGTGASP